MNQGIAVGTVGVVVTTAVAAANSAGAAVTGAMIQGGAPPALATATGMGTTTAVLSAETQVASDALSGRGVDAGRTVVAGGLGFTAGFTYGAVPAGTAGLIAKAEMGVGFGLLQGAFNSDGTKTLGEVVMDGTLGGVGAVNDMAGTAGELGRSLASRPAPPPPSRTYDDRRTRTGGRYH